MSAAPTLTPAWTPAPVAPVATASGSPAGTAYRPLTHSPFDQFEPLVQVPARPNYGQLIRYALRHPLRAWHLGRMLKDIPGESRASRMAMFLAMQDVLTAKGQYHLDNLLRAGVLSHRDNDDGRSTLYQLYARLATAPAAGFDSRRLLEAYVAFLDEPYQVTQKPGPVLPEVAQQMQLAEMTPVALSRTRPTLYQPKRHTLQDIQIDKTFDCATSAVMYGMADQQPSELIRQLNGLTSPRRSFYKKVNLKDLSPSNPQEAVAYFQKNGIHYRPLGPEEGLVEVQAPYAVYLRALSDDRIAHHDGSRNAIQALYQMSLAELPEPRAYDEVNDTMMMPDGSPAGEGLPGEQIDLVSSIIEGKGGTQSVTTQVYGGKQNPRTDRESTMPYLFGYTLPFHRIEWGLVQALRMNKLPMVGIVYTDEDAAIPGGHYFRITGARVDPTDNQLKFTVVDSDDDNPLPVEWPSSELIPMINRVHLPAPLAAQLQGEINAQPSNTLLTPGPEEAARYQLLPLAKEGAQPLSAAQPTDGVSAAA